MSEDAAVYKTKRGANVSDTIDEAFDIMRSYIKHRNLDPPDSVGEAIWLVTAEVTEIASILNIRLDELKEPWEETKAKASDIQALIKETEAYIDAEEAAFTGARCKDE